MKVVAINTDTRKHFESQGYQNEDEKVIIEECLRKDALLAAINIEIAHMTDAEFEQFMTH